jgi:hypothetical protein
VPRLSMTPHRFVQGAHHSQAAIRRDLGSIPKHWRWSA